MGHDVEWMRGKAHAVGGASVTQPEGSHVHWLASYDDVDEANDGAVANLHRMRGTKRGVSSAWTVRLPNDDFVGDEAVTLEEMQARGAL